MTRGRILISTSLAFLSSLFQCGSNRPEDGERSLEILRVDEVLRGHLPAPELSFQSVSNADAFVGRA